MKDDKPLVWMKSEIKTPPFSLKARIQTGVLIRRIQQGEIPDMPHSRPMPKIGAKCHELRINDERKKVTRRIIYHISHVAIVILDEFEKKTDKTPQYIINRCKKRLKVFYEDIAGDIQ